MSNETTHPPKKIKFKAQIGSYDTSNRKLAVFNELRNTKISPNRASTDSTETKDGVFNFSVLSIYKILKECIEHNASEIGTEMA